MESSSPDVTVCIPAYRSGDFIESTLVALSRQTYSNFRALISIDGPDETTEAVCCRVAAADPRFEVIVQRDRLGWLGNTNALFDKVTTEFFFILPHDDFIAETYIEELRRAAVTHPQAVNVYCDMERHGRRNDVRSTPGLDGPFLERIESLFSALTEAVSWRGLTRSSVLSAGYRMRSNGFDSYNSHVVWVLTLLCLGPFHHVPKPLYRQWERKDENSVTTGWRAWTPERRYSAMAEHTLQCIETVSTVGNADAADRHALVLLLLMRLLARARWVDPPPKPGDAPIIDHHLLRAAELLARINGLG